MPAVGFGCSHAILGRRSWRRAASPFPPKNRGLATVLLLAAWDFGLVIASPSVGVILKYSESVGLPPYPTMFLSMAGLLTLVTLWYAVQTPRSRPRSAPAAEKRAEGGVIAVRAVPIRRSMLSAMSHVCRWACFRGNSHAHGKRGAWHPLTIKKTTRAPV